MAKTVRITFFPAVAVDPDCGARPKGTSSIVHEETHQPLLSTLSSVVETVVKLRQDGHRVVLVSSGAIGIGLKRMNMAQRSKSLSGKQVGIVQG